MFDLANSIPHGFDSKPENKPPREITPTTVSLLIAKPVHLPLLLPITYFRLVLHALLVPKAEMLAACGMDAAAMRRVLY